MTGQHTHVMQCCCIKQRAENGQDGEGVKKRTRKKSRRGGEDARWALGEGGVPRREKVGEQERMMRTRGRRWRGEEAEG